MTVTAAADSVVVQNTAKPSSFVTDMAACAMACDADLTCNAASFYSDASVYGGNNCWLKIIGDPCELPADAQADPEATLLLKQDTCAALHGCLRTASAAVLPDCD